MGVNLSVIWIPRLMERVLSLCSTCGLWGLPWAFIQPIGRGRRTWGILRMVLWAKPERRLHHHVCISLARYVTGPLITKYFHVSFFSDTKQGSLPLREDPHVLSCHYFQLEVLDLWVNSCPIHGVECGSSWFRDLGSKRNSLSSPLCLYAMSEDNPLGKGHGGRYMEVTGP